jgi:hypothetical protein
MKKIPEISIEDQDIVLTGAEADAMRAAIVRMHERDRERVASGELTGEDLHASSPEWARSTTLVLTPEATTKFKYKTRRKTKP